MKLLFSKKKLAGFKWGRIKDNLNNNTGLDFIDNYYVYAVSIEGCIDKLKTLLGDFKETNAITDNQIIVLPRRNTTSPWSSKAKDIIEQCKIPGVIKIERGICYQASKSIESSLLDKISLCATDRMTEEVISSADDISNYWEVPKNNTYHEVDILSSGFEALVAINSEMGLSLDSMELELLYGHYKAIGRNPTDVELMTFAQVNSEHCRHKIFNASWCINGEDKKDTLFKMIKNTTTKEHSNILSAYVDNAAVVQGFRVKRLVKLGGKYSYNDEECNFAIKVETHNHPTAVSPNPGAATGVGGEIRDEAACGVGAKTKAGLCGYSVSNLSIPGLNQDIDVLIDKAPGKSSALSIIKDAPVGALGYGNEFGRPNILGYFRSYCARTSSDNKYYGYHKPIMLAGGIGSIRSDNVEKKSAKVGDYIVILGGPGFLIGLGGGAASSRVSSENCELDFASVQRGNPEMQRRAQDVIDECQYGSNPILSIHDVGAGGLSNAIPELVHQAGLGANINLRAIDISDKGMSPLEIWCNESQERYVLIVSDKGLERLTNIARRENCPISIVGTLVEGHTIVLEDPVFDNVPLKFDLNWLFTDMPQKYIKVTDNNTHNVESVCSGVEVKDRSFSEIAFSILSHPSVASKRHLITISDRTVGGLVVQDQMVGPWQVPVADCAVTAMSYLDDVGEVMSIGERPCISINDSCASVRMAIAESITNLMGADLKSLKDIAISANWMVAAKEQDELAKLYVAVEAASEFCKDLQISIPVGKDSMSMTTEWDNKKVVSPLSLVATAFAKVNNIRKTLTPYIDLDQEHILFSIYPYTQKRLGKSIYSEVTGNDSQITPDISSEALICLFNTVNTLKHNNIIRAYHDCSDGGLWASLCEMLISCRAGLKISLTEMNTSAEEFFFSEEIGCLVAIRKSDIKTFEETINNRAVHINKIGLLTETCLLDIEYNNQEIFNQHISSVEKIWSRVGFEIQKIRANPQSAMQEFQYILNSKRGLKLSDEIDNNSLEEQIHNFSIISKKPKVAILREQGTQSNMEMAAAMMLAGFDAVDVHMNDLLQGDNILSSCHGLVACGGFSYGDVLGAGTGWANKILLNDRLKDVFTSFFSREDTFSLGVCNGCQMLSQLSSIIPGSTGWPKFVENESGQYESRVVQVRINNSKSILFNGMHDLILPIVVAHGEGRVSYDEKQAKMALSENKVIMSYIDDIHLGNCKYPSNPNGSTLGVAGVTSADGRVTIMMPHPERMFLGWQQPLNKCERYGPWMQMFLNARKYVNI